MGELVTSILRFKWTLIVIAVLVSAPLIAAIWTQIVPEYQARGEVWIRPIIPRLVFETDENGQIPFYESFVNTQVSIMQSTTVLQRVIGLPEIQQTSWYENRPKTLLQRIQKDGKSPLERLKGALSIKPRTDTEIVDVSFLDASAQDATVITEAVLNQYIQYRSESSDATEDRLYRQLAEQYKALETEIDSRETISARLKESLGTGDPQALVASRRARLDETEARLTALQQRLILLAWEVEQAAKVKQVAQARVAKQPQYYEDPDWRQLNMRVKTLDHQMNDTVYAPQNPALVQMGQELKFARELLAEREIQLDQQWQTMQQDMNDMPPSAMTGLSITTLKNMPINALSEVLRAGQAQPESVEDSAEYQYNLAKEEEALLLAEVDTQRQQFKALFADAQMLEEENNTLQHKRRLFDTVRERLDQKEMERGVPGSIEILTHAYVSPRPSKDSRAKLTVLALFLGLGLGGGVAFQRAGKNQVIYAPRDMPMPVQTPFLGCLPMVGGKGLSDYELNPVIHECIRTIRTSFFARLNGRPCPMVMVTSATHGTGKSSLTEMLGKSIAQTGKKVLLIDADIHKRSLTRQFDVEEHPGFVESLHGRAVGKEHIVPTQTYGLDIMPTGQWDNDQVVFEELASEAFKQVIGQIVRKFAYDIVLLDGPPIMAVADATIIAGQIDGVILVEREHVSHRINVADALIRLNATGGRLLGTIFVGTLKEHSYPYGYREKTKPARKQKRQAELKTRRMKWTPSEKEQ
jgi:capsular exopolysaccharide synthesis family protein